MSRRPAPSGLTKDTSEGQAYSRGSPPSGLGLDITSVHSGDYSGLVRFIKKYPRIADTQEIQRLLAQASVHKTAGESSLAETCVHHALVLRKWCSLGPQEAGKYFESLAEGGQTTTEFMHDVTKVLMALPQKRAHALTATGTTQSQTRVFRENDDERLYYLEEQGHPLRPASNRRNLEPSRTLGDPATNDRNNREHGRTLVGHQRDLPSRRRQENPEPPRSLHDAATDDRNNREYGRTLVVHQQDLPSRQCQEDLEPSRPFSDVATDDRNNREHSRMLAGHQRDLPSRQRQENPKPFRSLNDTATDDQNSREHGRTLVRFDPMLSSRHRQESPNSTSRRKPQGEPELPLKPYFLPKEGINDDVVQRDTAWHSGATASTRPSVYNGRPGYIIEADESPTIEITRNLKPASTKYGNGERSSGTKRPPTSSWNSSRTFNERYRYDAPDTESGEQQMKIRDDDARYVPRQGPSRHTAISRHDQEHSRPRHIPDDDLSSDWHLVDKRTESEVVTSFQMDAELQISRNEQSRPVIAFLDTGADITCISENLMKSLPGEGKAEKQPVHIQPYALDDKPIHIIGRSTIYIAWEGTGFKKLVVYICSNPFRGDLLLSGNFIKENGLLVPGAGPVKHISRDLEPGLQVAVRRISVRGPKLRPLQQGPKTDPPSQPPPRGTPGMRMSG